MSAATQPIRLAIVGCGRIAGDYMHALGELSEFQPVAVVDPDPAAASRLAPDLPHHQDLKGMLSAHRDDLDAALVLVPPAAHQSSTCDLATAGLHVFCEKPLATDAQGAQDMLAAAEAADVTLMMGSKFRYVPDVEAARDLLQQGTIGRVALFEITFCSPVDMAGRWNADPAVAGGGVLIDNGCHAVDVARYLVGPIDGVHAAFGPNLQGLPVEDTARILFRCRNGALGAVDVSWSVGKGQNAYVRLHGEHGAIEVGFQSSRHKAHSAADWTQFGSGYDKRIAFRRQLADFAATIRGGKPTINPDDALASVRVIDAAYRSARSGGWEEPEQ